MQGIMDTRMKLYKKNVLMPQAGGSIDRDPCDLYAGEHPAVSRIQEVNRVSREYEPRE
jgi:hypothetical protein